MAVQTMPAISIDINMLWQILNFFILVVVFNKYLKAPLTKVLNERKEKIAADINDAKKSKEEAKVDEEQARETLKDAKKEAHRIITSAERKADERKDEILKAATLQRDKILQNAETEVAKLKEKARNEVKQEMEALAITLAEKIIKEKLDAKADKALVDDFISQIGEN